MANFIVASLPRSRSKWLSHFLAGRGQRQVGHDLLVESDSGEDFLSRLDRVAGSCETGVMLGWKMLLQARPSLRVAVVWREPRDVLASLAKHGYVVPEEIMYQRAGMLEALAGVAGVQVFHFDSLAKQSRELYSFCTGEPCPQGWAEELEGVNIQIDLAARMRRLQEREEPLRSMVEDVLARSTKLGGERWKNLN